MLNRSKALAASLLAATFVLGAAAGGVAMSLWEDDDDDRRTRPRERVSYAERLADHLELTEAQQESVAVILERRQEAVRQMWQEVHPRYDSLRVQIHDDIMAVLEEEQRAAYEELIARSDSVRRHRRRDGDHRR